MVDTSWSQVLLYVAGSIAVVVWAIGQLIRTMGSGYGSIIVALQTQNTEQARQMAVLDQGQRDCKKQHEECEKKTAEQARKIEDLERSVTIIEHRLEDKADK